MSFHIRYNRVGKASSLFERGEEGRRGREIRSGLQQMQRCLERDLREQRR